MKSKVLLLLIGIFTFCQGMCNELAVADSAYRKGNYEEAVKEYLKVENTFGTSASLLFNLGNSYFQLNDFAKAKLCYERALKLAPGNKSIKNNIQFIDEKILSKNQADLGGKLRRISYDEDSFSNAFYAFVSQGTGSDTWAWLAAIAFILAIACTGIYFFVTVVSARKFGFFIGIIFYIFSGLFLAFAFCSDYAFRTQDDAVVTIFKTPLLSEPEKDSKPATTPLNAGTKVKILEIMPKDSENPQWYKVRMNSENSGWISASDIEII